MRQLDEKEKRLRQREWVIRRHRDGWSVRRIAYEIQLPRSTVHRWIQWSRQRRELEERKRGPRAPERPVRDDPHMREAVRDLRTRYGWGPRKISRALTASGAPVKEWSVYAIMADEGLNERLERPRKRQKYIRFERDRSNELWQTDFKWVAEEEVWLQAYLDDHSRFVPGAALFEAATTANALWLLEECVDRCGKPEEILTDHGSQFTPSRGGTSTFTRTLEAKGIKHILAAVRKPTTCGKIERWFGTFVREGWRFATLDDFVHYYNVIRPHQSLDYRKPVEVYERDRLEVSH